MNRGPRPAPVNGDPFLGEHPRALPVSRRDIDLLGGIVANVTFREAARAAGLTESSATRHLDRLQRRVGATLTQASGDGVRLTEAGSAMLVSGRHFLRRLGDAAQRIVAHPHRAREYPAHALSLAVADDLATGDDWDQFVDEIATSLPGVVPTVTVASGKQCAESFDHYHVDAAYTWCFRGEKDRLSRVRVIHEVIDEPLWVALPAGHPRVGSASVELADLAGDHWVVGAGEVEERMLARAFRDRGEKPRLHRVEGAVTRGLLWRAAGVALLPPTALRPGPRARFTLRPLVDGPRRRLVLMVDPTPIPDALAYELRDRLRVAYRRRAERRNPDYAATLSETSSWDGDRDAGAVEREMALPVGRPTPDGSGWSIEPDDVTTLRLISDHGSLNRAAPELLLSQPALTRRLKRLELRLGMNLLVRGYRGTMLTANARRLLDAADVVERDFLDAMRPFVEPACRAQLLHR